MWRWVTRYRVVLAIVATALIALAAVAVISFRQIVAERRRVESQRIALLVERARAERQRITLLVERARAELLAGNAGRALAYLAKAATDEVDGAFDFLVSDARRPAEAQLARLRGGAPMTVSPDGTTIATLVGDDVQLATDRGAPIAVLRGGPQVARPRILARNGTRLAGAGADL